MVPYSRILMAVSHRYVNEETVQYAVELARHHGAQLTLLGVVQDVEKEYENWLTTKLPQDLEKEMYDKQLAALQKQVESIKGSYYPQVDCAVVKGIPFVEIIRKVKRDGHDLLVMDAVSHKPGHKRFMGSTTKHVLRKCPCPVFCVRANKPIQKVLAAVDVFASSDTAQALNKQVLAQAHLLAQRESAQLHLVYAQQPIGEPMMSSWGIGSADMVDGMEADLIANAQAKLLKLSEGVLGSAEKVVMKVVLGNPRDMLPVYVEDHDIDLITMGTVCRTGIKGFLIGNTAESILSQVACSVLALKPEGFVSTVE